MKTLCGFCGLILVAFFSYSEAQRAVTPQGTDCSDIKSKNPRASSGVFLIQPTGVKVPFRVYCEMRSDGGWTVFQKRSGAQVKFDRNWTAYKNGFGNLLNDHWLGLKNIFSLTKSKNKRWTMRVELQDHVRATAFAEYNNFKLGTERSGYKLKVGKYRGTAGDAIRDKTRRQDQNGFGFSAMGRDNDGCNPCLFGNIAHMECAASQKAGWWFSRCGSASLNGVWHPAGDHIGWISGIYWDTWKTRVPYSLKATRMMIKLMK